MPYRALDQLATRTHQEYDVDCIDPATGDKVGVVGSRIHVWYFVDKKARHTGKYAKTRIFKNTSRT